MLTRQNPPPTAQSFVIKGRERRWNAEDLERKRQNTVARKWASWADSAAIMSCKKGSEALTLRFLQSPPKPEEQIRWNMPSNTLQKSQQVLRVP
jgi:hypothetical protein